MKSDLNASLLGKINADLESRLQATASAKTTLLTVVQGNTSATALLTPESPEEFTKVTSALAVLSADVPRGNGALYTLGTLDPGQVARNWPAHGLKQVHAIRTMASMRHGTLLTIPEENVSVSARYTNWPVTMGGSRHRSHYRKQLLMSVALRCSQPQRFLPVPLRSGA